MQDLTTGSITRHLLKTTSYMLVTMVFQTLYFLIDLYWVGHLGKEAVAGVGVAGNLTFIVLAITQMLGVGTTTLVSHAVGTRDKDRATVVFNQSLVLGAVVAVIFLVIGMAVRTAYADALSADQETARLAAEYLLWFIPAMALQFGIVGMGAALRGTGNFKPGMIVQTATVILNMICAPFLIFGWGTGHPMGVAGAAVATLIAVAVACVWLSTYFFDASAYLHFRRTQWAPRFRLWGDMLKVGLPAGAEFALTAVYLFFVYSITRRFGAAAQAGFGVGMRIIQSGFLPVVALGFAVAPVAGQNFGARHGHRVRSAFRTAALLATAVMAPFTVVCYLFAAPLIGFFSDDPAVVQVGTEYLRIVCWSFVGSGVVFVASSMFQALGNTLPALATSFGRVVLVMVPALIMARNPEFDLHWLWLLSAAAVLTQMLANLSLLRREFRVRLPAPAPVDAAA
jgi:putative MATE family efflux protein